MSEYLEKLREYKRKDERGTMANLRCILVESRKHRAWPALGRLGVQIKDKFQPFIAGLYAMHPEEDPDPCSNFGKTCKGIERRRNESSSSDNKLTPTERRFQHILAAEKHEVCDRVMRMARMAKVQGVPINYVQLEKDLRYWDDKIKTNWASAYWSPDIEPAAEEEL